MKTSTRISRAIGGRRPPVSRAVAYTVLLVSCGAIAGTFGPSLDDPGYLTAWDAEGHLLRAQYYVHHLLPEGHLTGWFPAWNGGFDLSQSYPPLFHYLLGGLLLPLPDETALRLATGLLWVGLIPAHYYLLRSFDLKRPAAALGAMLVVGLSESWGIGPAALYGIGLLPNGLGCVLAIVLLGRLKRDLSRPDRGSTRAIVTGFGVGLLILAHTFTAYWWLLASLVLAASEAVGRPLPAAAEVAKRYATTLGVGGLVSAWWWIPMLLGRAQMGTFGPGAARPRPDLVESLLLARGSGGIAITGLAIAGVAYLALSRQSRTLAFFLGVTTLSLLLVLKLGYSALPFGGLVKKESVRFAPPAAWLIVALAGFGLAGLHALLTRLPRPAAEAGIVAAGILLWLAVVGPKLDDHRGFIGVHDGPAPRELPRLEQGLQRAMRPGDFVLSEFSWESRPFLGAPHLVSQRVPALEDQAWFLNGNYLEATQGAERPYEIAGSFGDLDRLLPARDYLRARGARFLISTRPESRAVLRGQRWLEPVTGTGPALQAFELKGARPFGLPSGLAARLAEATYDTSSQAYRLRFDSPVTLFSGVSLAVSYHPWLRVTADGRRLATAEDDEHRLRLAETADDVETLEIAYRRSGLAVLGNVLSAAGLAGLAILMYRRRRG